MITNRQIAKAVAKLAVVAILSTCALLEIAIPRLPATSHLVVSKVGLWGCLIYLEMQEDNVDATFFFGRGFYSAPGVDLVGRYPLSAPFILLIPRTTRWRGWNGIGLVRGQAVVYHARNGSVPMLVPRMGYLPDPDPLLFGTPARFTYSWFPAVLLHIPAAGIPICWACCLSYNAIRRRGARRRGFEVAAAVDADKGTLIKSEENRKC